MTSPWGVVALCLCLVAGSASAQSADEARRSPLARDTIVVGGGDSYEPFHFIADGEPTGFDVDLVRAIARVVGLDIEVRLAYWREIRDGLEDGSVDVHIGLTYSSDRAEFYRFCSPYLNQQYKIFVRRDHAGIDSEEDLRGRRIIVQQDGVMEEYVREQGYTDEPVTAMSAAESLRKLNEGEGDCCLMTEFRGLTVARDLGFDEVTRVGAPVYQTTYGFALPPGRENLAPYFNQGLAILKRSGEYDEIYEKWFGVLAAQGPTAGDIVRYTGWIVVPLLVVLLMAALWSWSMRRQVVRQTAQLRQARDQAEAASEAKSRFLAAMSHELRTPLNGVLGMSEVLGTSSLDLEQREQITTIRRSASALSDIINDILEFSHIEAGQRELDRVEFSLRGVVADVLDTVSPVAWDKGLTVTSGLTPSLPDRVQGDPAAVRQVILNLMNNGVKFTTEGTVSLSMSCTTLEDDRLRISGSVVDTGVGVPLEARDSLFDAFTQVDSSSTREYGGTGLGLAICNNLVALMDGSMGYSARPTGGSEFSFSLVLEAVESPVAEDAPEPAASGGGRTSEPILVVEDCPTNQRVVCMLLKKWGYRSEVVENGLEAVNAFKNGSFGAIIMDCQMPVMDGLEATEAIRELEGSSARVPIIALTAGACMSTRDRCLAVGMDDYLTKPVNAGKLEAVLQRWAVGSRRGELVR